MMLNLVCIVGVLLAFASPTVWALQSVTTGFVILQGVYSDKTSCTPSTATTLNWAPMNVCMKLNDGSFVKYSADSSNNVYSSPYADSACTTVSGTDVKYSSVTCTNGVSFGIYSATQPDAMFNIKTSGYVTSTGYSSTDTSCTGTPTAATYFPIRTCTSATSISGGVSSIISQQYIVDASGNTYQSTYLAGGSCTSPIGSVTINKLTQTNCVTNGGTGAASSNLYATSLPATSATTLFQTSYDAAGCTGNVKFVTIQYGITNCPYTSASCSSSQSSSVSYLCGAGTSITKLSTGFAILNGYFTDTSKCTASSAIYVVYAPLNACVPAFSPNTGYQMYSADTNYNIYMTGYTDSACKTSTGLVDVKQTSNTCTSAGTAAPWGPIAFMVNFYSATQPDTVFNVQSSGYVATNVTYAKTDTKCSGVPTSAIYFPLRTCVPYGTAVQVFADASNNAFFSSYSGSGCTGAVATYKAPPIQCGVSGSQFLYTASLPATTPAGTQLSLYYSGTGCSGTVIGTQILTPNICPYTTSTCISRPSGVTDGPVSKQVSCITTGGSPTNAPIAASGTYDLQSVASALQSNGASVTNALASAYPGITVSNPTVTNDGSVITATQNIPSGVTLDQASIAGGPFQVAYTQAVANSAGVPTTAITGLTASQGRRLLAGVNMNYRINRAVTNFFNGGGIGGVAASPTSSSSSSCFAGTEMLTLASGITKAMSEVQVGDRVLTINNKGEQVYSDVVYLPHGQNEEHTTFAQITTESGRDLKMTMNHILPAGACALSTLPLVAARQVAVGDCVQTVSGREQVVSIGKVKGKGVYTIIAMEELIVVNGIVATPYGGINPTLANLYYNLHRVMFTLFHGKTMVSNGLGWMQGMTEGLWTMLSLSA